MGERVGDAPRLPLRALSRSRKAGHNSLAGTRAHTRLLVRSFQLLWPVFWAVHAHARAATVTQQGPHHLSEPFRPPSAAAAAAAYARIRSSALDGPPRLAAPTRRPPPTAATAADADATAVILVAAAEGGYPAFGTAAAAAAAAAASGGWERRALRADGS